MVFDLLIGHQCVFVLFRGELITLGELKRKLYASLADESAVKLNIHVTEALDLQDTRAAFAKLYVVLAFGLLAKDWNIEIIHW